MRPRSIASRMLSSTKSSSSSSANAGKRPGDGRALPDSICATDGVRTPSESATFCNVSPFEMRAPRIFFPTALIFYLTLLDASASLELSQSDNKSASQLLVYQTTEDNTMEGSALQRFEFDGDAIDVQKDGNEVFVSVKRVCEALGVDYPTQQAKLKEKEWATIGLCPTVAEDGKQRQMTMLHLDSLPLWLATIDAGRVAEDARPKLLRYQKECARVLADHFLGRRASKLDLKALPKLTKAISSGLLTRDEARATLGLPPAPSIQAVKAPLDLDRALSEIDLVDGMTTADVLAELGLPDTRSNQVRVGAALKRAGFRRSRVRRGGVGRGYQYCLNPLNHRG